MGCPKRLWYPGMIAHVVNRGNRKENIFREDMDFKVYLKLIRETLEKYSDDEYKIICYCLMTNHVHILLKSENKNISYFMNRLNSTYAKYFNSKYDFVGHLFQDRYYSGAIKNEDELLRVSKYIHLNPVKANIANAPELYKWSSYRMLIGKEQERLIDKSIILDNYKYESEEGKSKAYKMFINKEDERI